MACYSKARAGGWTVCLPRSRPGSSASFVGIEEYISKENKNWRVFTNLDSILLGNRVWSKIVCGLWQILKLWHSGWDIICQLRGHQRFTGTECRYILWKYEKVWTVVILIVYCQIANNTIQYTKTLENYDNQRHQQAWHVNTGLVYLV